MNPQPKDLFEQLDTAIAEWVALEGDVQHGATDPIARIREALDLLSAGTARHKDLTTDLSQRIRTGFQSLREEIASQASWRAEAEHRIEQLEKTIAKRRDVSTEDQLRITKLEHDLVERGETALAAQEKVRQLQAELDMERQTGGAARNQVMQIEKALGERSDALQAAQRRVTQLERDAANALETSTAAQTRAAELEQRCHELEVCEHDASQRNQETESIRQRTQELEAQIAACQDQMAEQARTLEAMESVRQRVAELEQRGQEAEAQLAGLEQTRLELEQTRNQVATLETREREQQERLDSLTQALEKAQADEQATALDLEVTMADLTAAREERDKLSAAETQTRDALAAAEARLADFERQLAEALKRAETLETKLREEAVRRSKSALAQELAEALRENETAQEQMAQLRAEIDRLHAAPPETATSPETIASPETPPVKTRSAGRGRDRQRSMGDTLIAAGIVSREQVESALEETRQTPQRNIGDVLVEKGLASEEDVARARAEETGSTFVRLADIALNADTVKLLSDRLARLHTCIPVRVEKNTLVLAMVNPLDLVAIEDIERSTNLTVSPVQATASAILDAIARFYSAE